MRLTAVIEAKYPNGIGEFPNGEIFDFVAVSPTDIRVGPDELSAMARAKVKQFLRHLFFGKKGK